MNMPHTIFALLFSFFQLILPIYSNGLEIMQSGSSDAIQQKWVRSFNNKEDVRLLYLKDGAVFYKGKLFKGEQLIEKKIKDFRLAVGENISYQKIESHSLRPTQKFELGIYKANNQTFYTVIGWRNKDGWKKEVEIIYEKLTEKTDALNQIDFARNKWEEYSNNHDPDGLIDQLFSKNGYYFNRGRVFQGEEIKEAYSYMKGEKWKIKLETLSSTQLSDRIVFDIGTFQSSGKGLYFLLWSKNNEKWELLLDFNF